jgi:hypothetical protein
MFDFHSILPSLHARLKQPRSSGRGSASHSSVRASFAAAALLIALPTSPQAQETLLPGQAFVTKFSGTATVDRGGGPRAVIDLAGTVGVALDLRAPRFAADGRHWLDKPRLFTVTAGDIGQVFGVALDDANPPNIYLTATSAFGLHRNADNSNWLAGMWGPSGGPGTIYRLNAANHYRPEIFANVALSGRANTGAALGNIAFDRWHRQLYVSDLETGMIHRFTLADGADRGNYDHGVTGRANFTEAGSTAGKSLPQVAFDPASAAHVTDCANGDFTRTPSCWNFGDFRRRVWGLDVRSDADGRVRLYYAVWGSQGFGNPDWAGAGDDQKNSVWSVAIADDGSFDTSSVRREFFLPEFFRSPEAIARAGISNPVADIAFPKLGAQNVMLVAERGGIRNLGLSAEDAFAYPHEARVLRYELDRSGVWQPVGRYDVGFYDRRNEGPPYIRAGAAGGVAFGTGYDAQGQIDPTKPDGFVCATGDAICSPDGACFDPATNTHSDVSQVSGLEGVNQSAYQQIAPPAAFQPYPTSGAVYPPTGPDHAYMIDADVVVDASGNPIPAELARNDATRIGDVVVFQAAAPKKLDLMIAKRAVDPSCQPGGTCRFEVVVTNVGDLPYSGPLLVRDSVGSGTLVGPPSPGWSCQQKFVHVYDCSHAPLDLAPGDAISFQLTVQIPAWWKKPVFSNCVELTTPGIGVDARLYNNNACGYAPTGPGGPDLQLTKYGVDGQCDWLNNCLFAVRITNVGGAPYSGPLNFHDDVKFGGTGLSAWAPGTWACGPVGATAFDCSHPPVTLAPGDFREVILWITGGPILLGHSHVRNCAYFNWGGAPHDYNPGNEYDCATISRFPPGYPGVAMLDINKQASPSCTKGGGPGGAWRCLYKITLTNVGAAPYFGTLQFSDATALGPGTLSFVDAPWSCAPGTGAPAPQTCQRPGVPGGLLPGQSVDMDLAYDLPAAVPVPSWLVNCATVKSDWDGNGIAEDHTACATETVCDPASGPCPKDLAVTKVLASATPCFPGSSCGFLMLVTNLSDQPFPGPVVLSDLPDPGAGPPVVVGPPGWSCAPAGPSYTCTWPNALPGGGGVLLDLEFPIPPGYPLAAFKNCASIPPDVVYNPLAFNDKDCATAFVPFPDLAPFGGTTCQRGASCTLDVAINNKGLLPFIGRAGLRGTLAPAVTVTSVSGSTPGLNCRVTGAGAYECDGARLNIAAGGAARLRVVIAIPADFAGTSITHTKDMVWPDPAVKDKRPENDRQVSTITIAARPPITCTGGTVRNNECFCPTGSHAQQTGPNAYRCGTPIVCTGGSVSDNQCVCPQGMRRQQVGTNAYQCVANLVCTGGTVRDNQCFCPQGEQVQQTGPNAYRCIQPPIVCTGGTVRDNQCFCPAGMQRQQTGPNAYRCVSELVCTGGTVRNNECVCPAGLHPQQTGPNAYRCIATIVCVGGTVRDNACVCPQGMQEQQTGPNAYRCVAPIVCTGGNVRNNECVCPQGMHSEQTGPNAYRCVGTILCVGGTVRDNQCFCPAGLHPEQAGPNAYRCLPTITCTGGNVSNNQCVCPQGQHPQQTGTNAYRCMAAIVCTGGTVNNNQCVCPQGTRQEQTGANAYRCVAAIVCSGGTVRGNQCVCPQGTRLQQTGTNAYSCVATLICIGGTVRGNQCTCPQGMHAESSGPNAFRCVLTRR